MFTGLVEEIGTVAAITGDAGSATLTVRGATVSADAGNGASIAVNGVCLTVTNTDAQQTGLMDFDVMGETLARTSLGRLTAGAPVNLERPMAADGRFGGHLVQGHVDGTGVVESRSIYPQWQVLRISMSADLQRYLVRKGSITVDGVSLTVSGVGEGWFEVSLIPATLAHTTLGRAATGDQVNLEVDVLAKYAENRAEVKPVTVRTDPIESALAALRAGKPVVVLDDPDRENEGDLVMAAELATDEWIGTFVRYGTGYLCTPMTEEIADRLELPPMTEVNTDSMRTAFTVTADAARGVSTGISAQDRCRTIHVLADPASKPADLTRPGHVNPLRAKAGGVLVRPGHTEAAVDLLRLAGLRQVGVIVELAEDDGSLRRAGSCRQLADQLSIPLISIADLAKYLRMASQVHQVAEAELPLAAASFRALAYRCPDGTEHLAVLLGDPQQPGPLPVRVHSECLTGDAFGSLRCDCGNQLDAALTLIAKRGRGAVIYLRGHEGRGIGLAAKIGAYHLQDNGLDTVDANLELGFPADARDYAPAAAILHDLGVTEVELLTNNPAKCTGLTERGITIASRTPLIAASAPQAADYLATKRDRMGHQLP